MSVSHVLLFQPEITKKLFSMTPLTVLCEWRPNSLGRIQSHEVQWQTYCSDVLILCFPILNLLQQSRITASVCYIISPSNRNMISTAYISLIYKTINEVYPKVVGFLLSLYAGARSFLSSGQCRSSESYVVSTKSILQFEKVRIFFLWHYVTTGYSKSFLRHLLRVLLQDTSTVKIW